MRADDAFWAARRVLAFTDEAIRAAVRTGQISDTAAETYLVDALIKRRNAIVRAYLPAVNPIVDVKLDADGTLAFANAAVDAQVATAPAQYRSSWFTFDNATGATKPLGEAVATTPRLTAPARLGDAPGSYIEVRIWADSTDHPSWTAPIVTHFRREAAGWKLVGLQRQADAPEKSATAQ